MSMVVWVMMGIAVWHFTVFLPDRFWGGIVGAFLAAIAGGGDLRLPRRTACTVPGRNDTEIVQALIAVPGAMIGLALSYLWGARMDREPAWTTVTRARARTEPAATWRRAGGGTASNAGWAMAGWAWSMSPSS